GVDDEFALGHHVRPPRYHREDPRLHLGHTAVRADRAGPTRVRPRVAPLEAAADHALLNPRLAWRQLAVRGQAGELGAGARAARRAVVSHAGAEHEGAR